MKTRHPAIAGVGDRSLRITEIKVVRQVEEVAAKLQSGGFTRRHTEALNTLAFHMYMPGPKSPYLWSEQRGRCCVPDLLLDRLGHIEKFEFHKSRVGIVKWHPGTEYHAILAEILEKLTNFVRQFDR